jgi:hypothetical protein
MHVLTGSCSAEPHASSQRGREDKNSNASRLQPRPFKKYVLTVLTYRSAPLPRLLSISASGDQTKWSQWRSLVVSLAILSRTNAPILGQPVAIVQPRQLFAVSSKL